MTQSTVTMTHTQMKEDAAEIARLRAENELLRGALNSLTNETEGITVAFEHEIRYAIGNTNFNILTHSAKAARAALQRKAGE